MDEHRVPGMSVVVYKDGEPIAERGYGFANLEHSVHATAETVYQVGSLTKQFTAAAIMLLIEEGKLALTDGVSRHLPEAPATWSQVSVHHLLNHTSGIPSYTKLIPPVLRMDQGLRPDEVFQKVAALPLDFQPGEKFEYNNSGYLILGLIIERVSGQPYGKFLESRIFKPLGMSSTMIYDWLQIIPNRGAGYVVKDGKWENAPVISMSAAFSAGALMSNAKDLAVWAEALRAGKVLKPESLDLMWNASMLKSGVVAPYGFGWAVQTRGRVQEISHGGAIVGFSSYILLYPREQLTVVILANTPGSFTSKIARQVARLYLTEAEVAAEEPDSSLQW
jgi:D-alanyl-D-alanine carboxypeptidase